MTPPSYKDLFRIFGRIGVLSFGGPAAQIALMHRELVDNRPWLTEQSFLRALSLCMLLPGPEAMQLATYAGWRLRGTWGGIIAGALFVLPGAAVIMALALIYAAVGQIPLVQAAFLGIKAAVIIVVFQALRNLSKKALNGTVGWVLALLAFICLFAIGVPFPLVILVAGLWGAFTAKPTADPMPAAPANAKPLQTVLIWTALWAAPMLLLWALDATFLTEVGLFFSKLAVVTFGGAYAVLGYMTQTVAGDLGWLTTEQMIDALGLAETTPGPLILVTEFVAMIAGNQQGGTGLAIAAGLLTLWVTFIPCFLWIFLAGPYLEQISAQPRIAGALSAITASVVGVIASLSLWFALHVLFGKVGTAAPLALPVPDWSSFNPIGILLVFAAWLLMVPLKRGFLTTMALLAVVGLGLGIAAPSL